MGKETFERNDLVRHRACRCEGVITAFPVEGKEKEEIAFVTWTMGSHKPWHLSGNYPFHELENISGPPSRIIPQETLKDLQSVQQQILRNISKILEDHLPVLDVARGIGRLGENGALISLCSTCGDQKSNPVEWPCVTYRYAGQARSVTQVDLDYLLGNSDHSEEDI